MNELEIVRIHDMLRNARARGASDVHFGGTDRAVIRIDGSLIALEEPNISEATLNEFCESTMNPAALERLRNRGTADGTLRSESGANRIHAFRHIGGIRVVVRLLPTIVPTLESLHLPAVLGALAGSPSGLLLFSGPAGSGKTTALAATIDRINRTQARTVVTVEDPVEYVHAPIRSIVTHCEIGRDVSDYAEAVRGFMRADPNVISIGEMRDAETMEAALAAAETGHLVLATLHTSDAPQTIDRILDGFPGGRQTQVRTQLAAVLLAVFGLRLVPLAKGSGRTTAAEIMIASDAVRALVRDGKTHQLRNTIATARSAGMQTLESHLSELVVHGTITADAARSVANRPQDVQALHREAV
jgi:twitching motility protein PilT